MISEMTNIKCALSEVFETEAQVYAGLTHAEHSMHNRKVDPPIFQIKAEKVSKSKARSVFFFT